MVVLRHALAVAEMSGRCLRPNRRSAWSNSGALGRTDARDVPAEDAIAAARLRCGWQRIRVDGNRVYQPGGVRLDFSSIAKGFAVDKASAYLHSLGKPDHLVEIGGELSGSGTKPDGGPWWVALESPPLAADNHGSQTTRNSRRAARACDCDLRRQPALFPTRRAPAVPYDRSPHGLPGIRPAHIRHGFPSSLHTCGRAGDSLGGARAGRRVSVCARP